MKYSPITSVDVERRFFEIFNIRKKRKKFLMKYMLNLYIYIRIEDIDNSKVYHNQLSFQLLENIFLDPNFRYRKLRTHFLDNFNFVS
jgi:hypothetical protein